MIEIVEGKGLVPDAWDPPENQTTKNAFAISIEKGHKNVAWAILNKIKSERNCIYSENNCINKYKKIIILKKIKRCFNLANNVLKRRPPEKNFEGHYLLLFNIRRFFLKKNPSLNMSAIEYDIDKKQTIFYTESGFIQYSTFYH